MFPIRMSVCNKLKNFLFRTNVTVAASKEAQDLEWESAQPYESIPGPKPLPFIPKYGNFWRFLPFGTFGEQSVEAMFIKMYERYGPIYKLEGVGLPDMIVIFDPVDAEALLRNEGPWPIRRALLSLDYYRRFTRRETFGDYLGVATTQGEEWSKMRSAVNQPMLQPRNVKQYSKAIEQVADEFVERIHKIRQPNLEMPEDFKNELNKWALESISVIALDARLGCLNETPNPDAQRMINSVHEMFRCIFLLDLRPSLWQYISTPAWRRLVKAMDTIVEVAMKNINKKMKEIEFRTSDDATGASILEILLQKDGGKQIAITMAMDMMLAGIDTTSGTAATTLYYISQNPRAQEKLHQELKELMEKKDSKLPSDFTNRIPYLKACIKEGQRMMPLAVGNFRQTIKNMVIQNYQIPKGTDILISHIVMCRQEEHFKRPDDFFPERWLKDVDTNMSSKNAHPFVFLPFGFGPRMCIGRRMAEMEMQTLLIKILRNFKVSYNYEMEWINEVLVSPKSPLRFKMEDREN